MNKNTSFRSVLAVLVMSCFTINCPLFGQQGASDTTQQISAEQQEAFDKFEELLTGAKLVGSFTVTDTDADSGKLTEETYWIEEVSKMETGDKWLFKARIKYADYDFTLPMPLDVEWAGDTPIITLTEFKVGTFGTFSARVLFYEGKYAGTWSAGKDHGGHLFGKVVTKKMQEAEGSDQEGSSNKESKDDDNR